jgi:hypothetical protein
VTVSAIVNSPAEGGVAVIGALQAYVLSDPAVTSTGQLSGMTAAALANPTVTAPAPFSANPAQTGSATFRVRNNSSAQRSFVITASRSGVVQTSTAASPVVIAAGAEIEVPVSWLMSATAHAGSTGTITLTASDGPYNGNAQVQVTTNTVVLSPGVLWDHKTIQADPGERFYNRVEVTNRSNTSRYFCWGTNVSNSAIIPANETPGCLTLAAFESRGFDLWHDVRDDAPAEAASTRTLALIDQADVMVQRGDDFTLTVNPLRRAPTATVVPAAQTINPGATISVSYTWRNNSNLTERLCWDNSSSNPGAVAATANPHAACIEVPAFGTVSNAMNIQAASQVVAGTAVSIYNRVFIEGQHLTYGSDTDFPVTVNMVVAAPVVVSKPDTTTYPGANTTGVYTITNNTNAPRTIHLEARNENHTDVTFQATGTLAQSVFVPAYGSTLVTVVGSVPSGAAAGSLVGTGVQARDESHGTPAGIWPPVAGIDGYDDQWFTVVVSLLPPEVGPINGPWEVEPNGNYTYTSTLINHSSVARTFNLTASATGSVVSHWAAFSPQSTIMVPGNSSVSISILVTMRPEVVAGTEDWLTITATDEGDAGLTGSRTRGMVTAYVHYEPTLIVSPTWTANGGTEDVSPDAWHARTFRLRNNSNEAATFRFTTVSQTPSVVPTPAAPADRTLQAYEEVTFNLPYHMNWVAAGLQSVVTLNALEVDGGGGVAIATFTARAAAQDRTPASWFAQDYTVLAGSNPGGVIHLRNNSNVSRQICADNTIENGNVAASSVFATAPSLSCLTLAAFGTGSYVASVSIQPTAVAGSHAFGATRAFISGIGFYSDFELGRYTVDVTDVAPTVAWAGDQVAAPGTALTHTLTVTNNSNTSRTICTETAVADGNVYGWNVFTAADFQGPSSGCISLAAFASGTLNPTNYGTRSSAQHGWYAFGIARGYIQQTGSHYGSTASFRLTIDLPRAAPSMSALADTASAGGGYGQTVSRPYTLTNNSGQAETICVSHASSNTGVVEAPAPTPAAPSCQAIAAGQTIAISLDYWVHGASYVNGAYSDMTRTAYVQADPTFQATATSRHTIDFAVAAAPTVTFSPATVSGNPGGTVVTTVTIRNNMNQYRTYNWGSNISNSASVPSCSGHPTGNVAIAPNDVLTFTLTCDIAGGAVAGSLLYTGAAYDYDIPSVNGNEDMSITVNTILVNPTIYGWDSQSWEQHYSGVYYFTIYNGTNAPRRFYLGHTNESGNVGVYDAGVSFGQVTDIWVQPFSHSDPLPVNWTTGTDTSAPFGTYMSAYDQDAPSYYGQAAATWQISAIPPPTIEALDMYMTGETYVFGETYQRSFRLRNNSAYARQLHLNHTNNTSADCIYGVVGEFTNPGPVTVAAGDAHDVIVTMDAQNGYFCDATQNSRTTWTHHRVTYSGTAILTDYYGTWTFQNPVVQPEMTCTDMHRDTDGMYSYNCTGRNVSASTVTYTISAMSVDGVYAAGVSYNYTWAAGPGEWFYPSFWLWTAYEEGTGWYQITVSGSDGSSVTRQQAVHVYAPGMAMNSLDAAASNHAYSSADAVMNDVMLSAPHLVCDRTLTVAGVPVACTTTSSRYATYHGFDFGNGSNRIVEAVEEASVSQTYGSPGEYLVTAYVVAADGATSAHRSVTIEVLDNEAPLLPEIEIIGCENGYCRVGETVELRVSATDPNEDVGDAVRALYLDLGDGRATWVAPGSTLSVSFASAAPREIRVVAYDRAGIASPLALRVIDVRDAAAPDLVCEALPSGAPGAPTTLALRFSAEVPIVSGVMRVSGHETRAATLPGLASGTVTFDYHFDVVGQAALTCEVVDALGRSYETTAVVEVRP